MSTTPFIGEMFLERGDAGSPVAYTRICSVFGISGLGKTKSLEDVTTFCSGGTREYIGGLADGSEITVNCNYAKANTQLREMIGDVDVGANRQYRLVVGESAPYEHFYMTLVPLGWELGPSVEGKNSINFTFKISGEIDVQDVAA